MATLFTLLFFIGLLGTLICLVKPSLTQFKNRPPLSRPKILIFGIAINIILLAMVGVFAPKVEQKSKAGNVEKKDITSPTKTPIENNVKLAESPINKAETSLGMTPEQFREKFNFTLHSLDIDSISPLSKFDVKSGSVFDSFQVLFSKDIAMVGTVTKDGQLKELTFIMGKTDQYEQAMHDLLIVSGISTKVVSPEDDKAGNTVVKLITEALKNIEKEDNSHSKIIGNVKYYAMANVNTGLWVGISPAED